MTKAKEEYPCPFCGSLETSRAQLSGTVFGISILFLGFPLPFFKRKYYCFDCKKEFYLKK